MSYTGTIKTFLPNGREYDVAFRDGKAVRVLSISMKLAWRVLWNEHCARPMSATCACAVRNAMKQFQPTTLDKLIAESDARATAK